MNFFDLFFGIEDKDDSISSKDKYNRDYGVRQVKTTPQIKKNISEANYKNKNKDLIHVFGEDVADEKNETYLKREGKQLPLKEYISDVKDEKEKTLPNKKVIEQLSEKSIENEKKQYQELPRAAFSRVTKKNVIILAIENTTKVREYKETVLKIISKIIDDNKESVFSVFRMGYKPKYFGMINYEIFQKNNVKVELLESTDEQDRHGLLYEVLKYIKHNINQARLELNKIEVAGEKCEITGYNIIFIGTGNFESSTNELSMEILKDLKADKKIKSIKYFCIDDNNTVKAAMIGFPLIGHIENNFYK